jgi:endonuclease YncB( thermonuclease family)
MRLPMALVLLLLLPTRVLADFTGPIVSVLDGDTIEILHNQRQERIRLSGDRLHRKGPSLWQESEASRVCVDLRETSHALDSWQ